MASLHVIKWICQMVGRIHFSGLVTGAILLSVPLKPRYSKCSWWTSSLDIELVRNAESQAALQTFQTSHSLDNLLTVV